MNPTRWLGSRLDFTRVAWRRFGDYAAREGIGRAGIKAVRLLARRAWGRLLVHWGDQPGAVRLDPWEALLRWDTPGPRRLQALAEAQRGLIRRPRFSLLTPVHNPPPGTLEAAIASVAGQSYGHWTLILSDDGSTDLEVAQVLADWTARDSRIQSIRSTRSRGIAAATNAAARVATGDFLVFLDHDDVLDPNALLHLARAVDQAPNADLIYSDEDKLDPSGRRFAPALKPAWSPELLLSFCYTGHLTAVRAPLFQALGGIREGFEGAQDHDFWLRAGERARQVIHVPQILYHWRVHPASTAASGKAKPGGFESGLRAVREAFVRRGVQCQVEHPAWAAASGWGLYQPVFADTGPSVTIVVHGNAGVERTLKALKSTSYRDYEVVTEPPCKATAGNGELLLFLAAGLEPAHPRWLSQLVGWLQLPGVGAVGPRVLDAAGKILHAGLVHGPESHLVNPFAAGLPAQQPGLHFQPLVTGNRTLLALDGLLTRRDTLHRLGGFDPQLSGDLAAADFCWKLDHIGLRKLVCAEADLIAHSPRQTVVPARELALYRRRHGQKIDPLPNPRGPRGLQCEPTVMPVSSKPVRLLAVSHNLNLEGAPFMQLELMKGLLAQGEAEPVVLALKDGPLRSFYEEAGIRVVVDDDPHRRLRLSALEQEERIDCVHVNTIELHGVVETAWELGVPSVFSIHESDPVERFIARTPGMSHARFRAILGRPYRVVFTAQSTLELYRRWETSGNFELVYVRRDPATLELALAKIDRGRAREELGITAADLAVLMLGTICERKGQIDLVRAYARLKPELALRIVCHVVGLRPSIADASLFLKAVAALEPARQTRFRFHPETPHVAPFFAAADLFVCGSRIESYPGVIIEAMQAGLPILTTPVFGINEQVREHENALFYQPGDAATLARHLERLAQHRRLLDELRQQSRTVLESLPTHEGMIRQYARILRAARESWVPESNRPVPRDLGHPHLFRASLRERSP